jgi:hypothetical protein
MENCRRALDLYRKRNEILREIEALTARQMRAIREKRTKDFVRLIGQKERCFEELAASEKDIERSVHDTVDETKTVITDLNSRANAMLEGILAAELEIRKRIERRISEIDGELSGVRKGKHMIKAYHTGERGERGLSISRKG